MTRYAGQLFSCTQDHTPFDIAAWHGTYYPYKYDLGRFSVVGSTLYDHPDPSIFTVLTAPSYREPGHAIVDFAIFPPRWLVMEDTYWPPYFHRNTMSEFAGMILQVPGKSKNVRFKPFGASLNSAMVPHGMDKKTHDDARNQVLKPMKVGGEGFMVFLFESEAMMGVTDWALGASSANLGPISSMVRKKSNL
jgi:homogentisate 1,2-dioxygenase